jgi:hypothetical protein
MEEIDDNVIHNILQQIYSITNTTSRTKWSIRDYFGANFINMETTYYFLV